MRHVGHIQFNVGAENVEFYLELYAMLGWDVLREDDGFCGVRKSGLSLWFTPAERPGQNDHDTIGVNHLGIEAETPALVEVIHAHITSLGIAALYNTPCDRPEFAAEGDRYYSLMFISPDGLLLEVVYTGPASPASD